VTLAGGLVYVTTGQSSIAVYKDGSSSLLWSNDHVRFLTATSVVVYGVDTNNLIEALKSGNGKLLWQSSTTYGVGTYFFVDYGLVTAVSGDNLSVYALKASNGTLQWHYALPQAIFSVSISQRIVFVTTLDGTIYAFKASNGTLLWKH
jgi:outer membrane protein assembly factor BamB